MADSYLTSLFTNGVYTIEVNGEDYVSGEVYDLNATYKVTLSDPELAKTLPLALLFATLQIALADVSACKAESYMNKIQQNQDIQVACSKAINEAKKMQEASPDTVAAYIEANDGWTTTDKLKNDTDQSFELVDITVLKEDLKENDIYAVDPSHVNTEKGTITITSDKVSNPAVGATGNTISTWTETCTYYMEGLTNKGMLVSCQEVVVTNKVKTITYTCTTAGEWNDGVPVTKGTFVSADLVLGSSSTPALGTKLTDDFVDLCYAAGVSEIDGVTIYILDLDGTPVNKNAILTDKQLEALITELEIVQEAASSTLQTDMVYAEDYLGQYNAYLNGGSSNIDDLTNALQTIAQRI